MGQHVLLATDGSDVASTAVEQGLSIAAQLDATVHVVSVLESDEQADEAARARRREIVEAVEDDAADRGIAAVTNVPTGDPGRTILEYADDNGIDLVVLGTHGRTGLQRWLMGSVATLVVREARCPVLTVNADVTDVAHDVEDVLLATDGRPGVETAVEYGLDLADAYGATVHAMYVVNDVHSRLNRVLEAFEEIGERSTSDIAERAGERGLEVSRSIERGLPHEEIAAYATDHDVDLVVVGTESRSGLDRMAAGSVSHRFIAGSPVPVLSARTLEK